MKQSIQLAIISVGDELLQGKVQDTNSTYISSQLFGLGVSTVEVFTIPDTQEVIQHTVTTALSLANVIMISGGLGPTLDDCTRDGIALALGRKLLFREDLWQPIQDRYPMVEIPEINRRQAYIIEGAESLQNDHGTAPGMWITTEQEKYIGVLPGPPREMVPMLHNEILPRVTDLLGVEPPKITTWRLYGAGESSIAEVVESFGIPHGCYTKDGWMEVQLLQGSKSDSNFKKILSELKEALEKKDIIQTDDKDLGLLVMEGFQKKGYTLAFAESLTGGELASTIVGHPGASSVLLGSVVAYSNDIKEKLLGVPKKTLIAHGAVSQETACAMAQGVRKISGADITVSVTGIAGPDGGSDEKPVGTFWMGVTTPEGSWEKQFLIPASRKWVIRKTTHLVYRELLEILG